MAEKTIKGLIKDYTGLRRKAEKEIDLSKGEKVENYYKGLAEAYAEIVKDLKELSEDSGEVQDTLEAKAGKSFWKGMFWGTVVGGICLAFLIQWIMNTFTAL